MKILAKKTRSWRTVAQKTQKKELKGVWQDHFNYTIIPGIKEEKSKNVKHLSGFSAFPHQLELLKLKENI